MSALGLAAGTATVMGVARAAVLVAPFAAVVGTLTVLDTRLNPVH